MNIDFTDRIAELAQIEAKCRDARRQLQAIQRAVDRLMEGCVPEPNSGCWLWIGSLRGGAGGVRYGQLGFGGRNDYAHRVAYRLFVGPIPDGLEIDHKCGVSLCCNPDHLEPVSTAENLRRSPRIAAWWAAGRWRAARWPDTKPLIVV